MYTPAHFAETDPAELHAIIRAHPLGALVTHTARGLDANHVPFLLDADAGPQGTLLAHVARANPVWRDVTDGDAVLVVFRATQGYVSPNWYPGKHADPRQVPTWNYEVVHAHGRIRVRDDATFVRGVVARLTRTHEAAQAAPWKMSDAPADYVASQLAAIVGLEVAIERLEGKRKLSQNRTSADALGAAQGLAESGQDALAAAVRRTRDPA